MMSSSAGGGTGITTLVSVVIPSRDRPDLVAEAVQSVLDQDRPVEVIVIDDGSDPALVAEGPLSDPRVQIIRNKVPLGPTKARNIGLRASTGDYLAFLDDDDVWLPGKLEQCLDAAAAFPEAKVVVHRTAFEIPPSATVSSRVDLVNYPTQRYGTAQTPHVDGVMVDGQLARQVEFDETFDAAQDVDFMLELARRSPFAIIDATLAVHGSQDTPTLVGIERRIAAREQLRDKHGDILYSSSLSRSFYHVRLGHLYRRRNERAKASRGFITALRYNPLNKLAWSGLAATALSPRIVRSLSLHRRATEGGTK